MPPSVIGQYRITGILGEGGMGVVYAAEHTLLGRPAAVKLLLSDLSSKQEIVQRFFNEARAATAIRHPGIVEIYDFGWTDDGSAFIVMELLRGETLRARRERAPMRWSTALGFVRQIAGALHEAHATGIIHRDLKPDNIFLVPDPEVPGGERIKLLDFGIAKLTDSLAGPYRTQTGAVMGTAAYMAPEQCRGVAVDARADIYSLGCILFELCTGRPPFVGEGNGDLIAAHIYKPPPTIASLMSGVPRQVEALVQRLLAKSAADRVQTTDELIRIIESTIESTKLDISQVAKSGPHPVLASSDPGVSPPQAPERPSIRRLRRDAVAPAFTSGGGVEPTVPPNAPTVASTPVAPAPSTPPSTSVTPAPSALPPTSVTPRVRLDTTLSSATGVSEVAATGALPPESAPTPRRRVAAFRKMAGGLAAVIAIVLVFVLLRGGGNDPTPVQRAASLAEALPAATATSLSTTPAKADPSPQPAPVTIPPVPPAPTVAPPSTTPAEPDPPPPPAPRPLPPAPPVPTVAQPSTVPPTPPPTAHKSATPQPPRPATVRITFDSTPRGARVMLGNTTLCETPCTRNIPRSSNRVRFVLRLVGYQDQALLIYPNKSDAYRAPLEQLPPSTAPAPSALPSKPSPRPATP